MIEAYVTNLGKYNEGELNGEYLKLPATKEDVQALLSRIDVDGVMYEEFFITDYEANVDGLSKNLGEYESLDELNYLAALLDEMDSWELELFEAALTEGDHTGSVKDLINLTFNLENYHLIEDVSDHEELGRFVMEEFDGREIPDWMQGYFDYDGYGRDFDFNGHGHFTESGYVQIIDYSFTEHYSGRDDLPEENKIFAYPKPEKSIKQALANYKDMISSIPKAVTERPLAIESRPIHESR
jgi:antirestriction protein